MNDIPNSVSLTPEEVEYIANEIHKAWMMYPFLTQPSELADSPEWIRNLWRKLAKESVVAFLNVLEERKSDD